MHNKKNGSAPKNSETSADFEIADNGFEKYSLLMKQQQTLGLGIVGGLIAFVVGLGAWTGIMLLVSYKLDWMALSVGLLIGFSIRLLGKGVEPVYGIVGGILAFMSSIAGNILTACIIFAHGKSISFLSVLQQLNIQTALYFLKAVVGPFDIIFCIGAILLGYYFAFKPLKGQ